MNLSSYIEAERGRGVALALALGIPQESVSQWKNGIRAVPLERCSSIEFATAGAVRRWDLRPDDWHRIWPELVGIDGAPDVVTSKVAA